MTRPHQADGEGPPESKLQRLQRMRAEMGAPDNDTRAVKAYEGIGPCASSSAWEPRPWCGKRPTASFCKDEPIRAAGRYAAPPVSAEEQPHFVLQAATQPHRCLRKISPFVQQGPTPAPAGSARSNPFGQVVAMRRRPLRAMTRVLIVAMATEEAPALQMFSRPRLDRGNHLSWRC